jgi:hypothetical protein
MKQRKRKERTKEGGDDFSKDGKIDKKTNRKKQWKETMCFIPKNSAYDFKYLVKLHG